MKKRTLLYALPIMAGTLLISNLAISKLDNFTSVNRAGDVAGPGVTTRKDCASCHSGPTPIANDNVQRVFTFDSGSVYTPSATHVIKFKLLASGTVGFSSTVLKNDSNIKAGIIAPIDTNEAKVFTHAASGRTYLNHKVGATANGMKEYTFQWTAPAKGAGAVTFYFSSISSNLDDGTSDDTTYNNSYVITEKIVLIEGLNNATMKASMSVYPNPTSDRININFTAMRGNATISLVSLDGKQVVVLMNDNLNSGDQNLSFDVSGVKIGIYFLRVTNNGMTAVQKVLVN
ncbi:MAG: T9SS type A sorting domain-containing protein [bacterium]|nr:T9SS type A sorting domain-containing protein [bacterium]